MFPFPHDLSHNTCTAPWVLLEGFEKMNIYETLSELLDKHSDEY